MAEPTPVFLCGMFRSGTTLLLSLLDGHPELVAPAAETGFFRRFLPRLRRGMQTAEKLRLAKEILLEPFHSKSNYYDLYLSHIPDAALDEALARQVNGLAGGDERFLPASILAFGELSGQLTGGQRFWVEKTPDNELFADQIYAFWPEARCIHIMRDPRDIFTALQRRAARKGRVAAASAFFPVWRRSARALRLNLEEHGASRYLSLRYEDLVTDPQAAVRKVQELLGISDDASLTAPSKSGGRHPWGGNSSSNQQLSGISSASVGQWRQHLTPETVALLEEVLHREMVACGYPVSSRRTVAGRLRSIPSRAGAVARRLRSALRQWRS